MPSIHEARVPHILQNDIDQPRPIRCGPASIQAILYGIDDTHFDPPGLTLLSSSVPVKEDQETIWTEVKNVSPEVAQSIGAAAGASEEQQVCEPQPNGAPPKCWITHPAVMGRLIKDGLDNNGLRLRGVGTSIVREMDEAEVPAALIDSIITGIGAAVLIKGIHWVVAYKAEVRPDGDLNIHYHDPAENVEKVWSGVAALEAAIFDIDSDEDDSQTVVVGARSGAFRRDMLPPRVERGVAPLKTETDLLGQDFTATVGTSARVLPELESRLGGLKPSRIRRVIRERKPDASYYLLEYDRVATVMLDAATQELRLIAGAWKQYQQLPMIIEADALAEKLDGVVVAIGDLTIKLDKGKFSIDPDLVWRRCDQSRSELVPFYVLQQPREGIEGQVDRLYVRSTDAEVFPALTRNLRGV